MSQLKTPLNLDPNFQEWDSATAIATANWTFTGTNATQIQLDRRHGRGHPERETFPSAFKSSDYIYNGRFSHRSEINTAGGSFTIVSNEFGVEPPMDPGILLAYRASKGLTVAVRVILAASIGGADIATLAIAGNAALVNNTTPRNFFWDTGTSTDITLVTDGQSSVDWWTTFGIQCPEVPAGARSMQLRLEVTDASATIPATFDLGEFSAVGQRELVHAGG